MAYIKSIPTSVEGVGSVMIRYPKQNLHMSSLTEHVMRLDDSNFTSKQRELIAAFTSGTNNCTFCYNAHKATAVAYGVDEDLLESLINDIDSSPIEDTFKPILHYVRKLTLTPSRIVQADVDAILEAGWDENDFHFVVMICALFNFYNRMMDGYGATNTPEFRSMVGTKLSDIGYGSEAWEAEVRKMAEQIE